MGVHVAVNVGTSHRMGGNMLLTGLLDTHPPVCVIPDDVLIQFGPPDDEHLLLETCKR